MIINKINEFIAKGEAPDAICLTLKGGKISIKEDCPSLTNNSDVIQYPRKVTVETLDAILIDFMNDLKWYFNTEDVSLPHKREVMFGEDGTITELLVDFYIGRIKKFMCD